MKPVVSIIFGLLVSLIHAHAGWAQSNMTFSDGGFSSASTAVCGDCGSPGYSARSCGAETCRISFGFDFIYIQPRFIESYDIQALNPATQAATLLPLDFDFSSAPRISLGYKPGERFGVRARYWQYDDSTARALVSGPEVLSVQQLTSIFPATIAAVGGDTLFVTNAFRTKTLDLEATYELRPREFEVQASVGVRYADLEQARQAEVTGVFPQSLQFQRHYRGFGLLAGLDARRPVGCCGLAFVIQGRGSVLHGNKDLDRRVSGTFPTVLPAPVATPAVVSLAGANETALVGEIGVGMEIRRRLGRLDLRGRLLYENRFWTAASTPALGLAGFEGFSLGLGTTW